MLLSPRRLADDIRLCKRATLGAAIGLAVLFVWAFVYGSLYGTNDLPMIAFLSRAGLTLGMPFVGGGILCGFAIHLLRERRRPSGGA